MTRCQLNGPNEVPVVGLFVPGVIVSFSHSWHGVVLPLTVIRWRFGTSSLIP